jgi:hypothetical protein
MSILLLYAAFDGASIFLEKLKTRVMQWIKAQWGNAPAPEAQAPL